jgi:hypothetical protein
MFFESTDDVLEESSKPKRKRRRATKPKKNRIPGSARRPARTEDGYVYVLEMILECGTVVYKVGVTAQTVVRRMMGILESFHIAYGYIPKTRIVHWEATKHHYRVEGNIHKMLENNRYDFNEVFSGHTEFFTNIEESVLLDAYRIAIDADESAKEDDRLSVW